MWERINPNPTGQQNKCQHQFHTKLILLVDLCSPCDWVLLHIPIVIDLKLLHAGQKIFFDKQLRHTNLAYLTFILVASGWRRQ